MVFEIKNQEPALVSIRCMNKFKSINRLTINRYHLKRNQSNYLLTAYICGMKILMVCLGNICRSPLAEGILQDKADKAGLNWQVDSAGTNGFHTGESPHHLSQKVAKMNGVDISRQISRKFETADLKKYDKIYVMAADVLAEMKAITGETENVEISFFLDELFPGENRDVPDPWYGAEDGYHKVFQLINQTCDAIISNYKISERITETA